MAQDSSPAGDTGAFRLLLYWAIVSVPLGWGVYKTVQKAVPLFHPVVASSVQAAAPSVVATPTPLPTVTPAAAGADPTLTAPVPEASPFSTAQPSTTVAPINTPAPPAS